MSESAIGGTVPAWISRVAARWPDRVALRSGGRQLTYRQLDELTGDVAGRLARAGTSSGDVVAVRSADRFDQVTGMLAVWRAGGVHLALDPAAPAGRNDFLIADSGARLVLDGDGTELPRGTGEPAEVRPEQLAYLVFTSGTTGVPKGVAVAHGPLAGHVTAITARFGIRETDTVLQFAQSTVDVAVEQVASALTTGACLAIPDRKLMSAPEFLQLLDTEQVTVANVAAGYFHDVVAALRAGRTVPACLRVMISGSDRLSPAAAAAWTELTGVRLLNAYGPTETVITATTSEVRGAEVPIGVPVGDRAAYVLDENLEPCDRGQLYLGGEAVATGYLGRPGLTADRFLPDPFGPPGARMYRTGDLVRRTGDELEFLGRADDQVKVRGFRIELGEVESALAAHPAVTACAVVAHGSPEEGVRLNAYVVGGAPGYRQVREFLAKSLPEHMIPATVTVLDALPLTLAGKVDRKALPEPQAEAGTRYEAPRTQEEQLVAGIWADVLGVPRIGLHDNFFHLGGDSLTAVRVAGRVFDVFGAVSPYKIFDSPTLVEFAAAVRDSLTEDDGARPGPVRRPAGTAPLSRFQRGLWVQECWQPGTSTYNVPWVFEFTGAVDAHLLGRALQSVVDRHEALRTTFEMRETLPCQVIHPELAISCPVADVSTEDELRAHVRADAQEPFDLTTGPLLRARAVRTDGSVHLILVFHHIIWDEGSLPVLDRELREYYEALVEARSPRLPELAVQYADYATWSREGGQLDYWVDHLRDAPTRPALATDHPRPAEPTCRGDYHRFAFDDDLARAVREFAKSADATPFMVLLAGLVLAVHRRGGADDLVVGTPVSVRERPELEALIGYFINLVPLRFRIGKDASVRDVLDHVREVALGGYRHQDVPLEEIAGRVLDERSEERHPLFQLVFEMHTADPSPLPMAGARLSRRLHVNELSRFDLSWSVEDDGTGFTGRIEYDTDVFDSATLAALGQEWQAELAAMIADPDAPVARPAPTPAGIDAPVTTLFENQVRRSPDTIAVISGDAELTYAELNARANRVARYLRGRGVTEGTVAAVLVERDADLVIGLLGVLKAGAGYTLLDPDLPAQRRQDAITGADARLVLTRDLIAEAMAGTEDGDLDLPLRPDSVACVMFTSGSTGRPKGVAASHRALAATYLGQDYAIFEPGQVWLQCSPVSWDAFGLELYGPLLFGGTCVLHPGQRPDPETMADLVARHGVTQLQLSASLFNFLVDEFPRIFANLDLAFTAGERASVPHVARLRERYPHVRIVNGYGPVESMGLTTYHDIGEQNLTAPAIPIGVPVANKDVYVLDEHYRPAATGEIYATGAGLALGYVGQSGLTADRFLPDPFGPPGARMYRTGDIGGRRPDGTLEITGRADDQVKIRGFRVEPGEVAAAISRHPDVGDCAVVVHEPDAGEPRLAAYLTTTAAAAPGYTAICEHLGGLLPDYMIPASVIVLDALPLTPNGKLDRAALPAPAAPEEEAPQQAVTEAERLVAGVWAEVLGVGSVGVHDSFFRLGGNSLAAVRVALLLSRQTGTRVPPRLVFAARTVSAMARRLETATTNGERL